MTHSGATNVKKVRGGFLYVNSTLFNNWVFCGSCEHRTLWHRTLWQDSDGDHPNGASNAEGMKKM